MSQPTYAQIRHWCLTASAHRIITAREIMAHWHLCHPEAFAAIVRMENDGALKPAGAGKWVSAQPPRPPSRGKAKALGDALARIVAEKFESPPDDAFGTHRLREDASWPAWLDAFAALQEAGYQLPTAAGFSLRVDRQRDRYPTRSAPGKIPPEGVRLSDARNRQA